MQVLRPIRRYTVGATAGETAATKWCSFCVRYQPQAWFNPGQGSCREGMAVYHMHRNAKARAKAQGLVFDITLEDVMNVFPKDDRCPVFGVLLRVRYGSGMADDSATLDRLIPSLGYIKGNIRVISGKANRIKQDVTDPNDFRVLADWMDRELAA